MPVAGQHDRMPEDELVNAYRAPIMTLSPTSTPSSTMPSTVAQSSTVAQWLATLGPGDVLCAVHDGGIEPQVSTLTFARLGSVAGDRILHLADPATEAALRERLAQEGLRTDSTALPCPTGDLEAVALWLESEAAATRADGLRTLRVIAEVDWLLGELAGNDQLFEWLAPLRRRVAAAGCLVLWRFDHRKLSAPVLLDALADQPTILVGEALEQGFSYLPGEDALAADRPVPSLERWLEILDEQPCATGRADASSLLRTVLETVGDGIIVAAQGGRLLHWNPSAACTLGLGPTLVEPERWPERYRLFLPDGTPYPAAELPLARALAGEEVDRLELMVKPEGREQPVWISASARPLHDAAGAPTGAVVVLRNVTRRKHAEQSLRESQSRLELLNQISTTFTSGVSVQRVIERAVEPIAAHFPLYRVAYSTIDGEGRRRTIFALQPPEMPIPGGRETELGTATDYLTELRAGQHLAVADVARDPRTAPLAPIFEREGTRARLDEPLYHSEKLVGVLSLESPQPRAWERHESLTVRQAVEYLALAINDSRAQEERRWAEQALRRSNEELQAFAHSISHDLKAPLRAIQGFSEALVEDYGNQLDENAHRYLRFIADGATRMGELIEDLLQHARLGRGGVRLALVEMGEVARRVVQSLTRAIHESGAEVTIAPDLPMVIGHRATLELMLQNLVSNALKFVPAGQAPKVEIGAESNLREHRIFVRDHGIGIDPKYHAGIFEIFHRLHSTAAFPGTGIGLAIVKKGAVLHEGEASVESAPGRGSTFWFTIPCEPKGSHGQ